MENEADITPAGMRRSRTGWNEQRRCFQEGITKNNERDTEHINNIAENWGSA